MALWRPEWYPTLALKSFGEGFVAVKRLFFSYPLASVLILAALVRLVAVIWSEGFIHSDDHFDTIAVAWDWLQGGLWGDDGFLRWKHKPAETIGRFPLYTLFLCGLMKICQIFGCESLGSMMVAIRGIHATISLLPVWALYRITELVTSNRGWAIAAGLVAGLHFVFPFLGVRNLVEVVGGALWIGAIYWLYRYLGSRQSKWLWLAGMLAGLAWMIRFQLAFAIMPVPLLLWWETREFRPALHFSGAVGAMLLLSGLTDLLLLGRFAGSTLTNLNMNTGLGALYNTIPLLYPALLLLLMIPPVSLVATWCAARWAFIRRHKLLVFSSLTFLAAHMAHPNQQERFILPMVPAFVLIGLLALYRYLQDRNPGLLQEGWFRSVVALSAGLNLILLIFFTTAYGHRGMVEPMKWFQNNDPTATVMIYQPEVKRWPPYEYAGSGLRKILVRSWDDPDLKTDRAGIDYFLLYPKRPESLGAYLDSLGLSGIQREPVKRFEPSLYDQLLHWANPSHNDNFDAYLYRLSPGSLYGAETGRK